MSAQSLSLQQLLLSVLLPRGGVAVRPHDGRTVQMGGEKYPGASLTILSRIFLGVTLLGACSMPVAVAQSVGTERIEATIVYRCGNEYLNNPALVARRSDCRPLERGNLTVVHGSPQRRPEQPRVHTGRAVPSSTARSQRAETASTAGRRPVMRIDPARQRERDDEARTLLLAELARAQERLAALRSQLHSPEAAERSAQETEALKTRIARRESDVQGIQRELARLPGGS